MFVKMQNGLKIDLTRHTAAPSEDILALASGNLSLSYWEFCLLWNHVDVARRSIPTKNQIKFYIFLNFFQQKP